MLKYKKKLELVMKFTKVIALFLSVFFVFMSVGCSEIDGEYDVASNPIVGPVGIADNLDVTNVDETSFPWEYIAPGKLKAWDINANGLIPVKHGDNAMALSAMDEIESVLGLTLFDRTSIEGVLDENIDRGLIVSIGTAIGPNGTVDENTCGMVSAFSDDTSWPSEQWYSADGNISTKLYVHVGSSMCEAQTAIAIHELGHALGMGAHFVGFGLGVGDGSIYDGNFWNVLYNIYHNNVGTNKEDININQIMF